jgi:hypothetical protein
MINTKAAVLRGVALVFGVTVACSASLAAENHSIPARQPVTFAVSAPLREMAELPQPEQFGFRESNPVRSIRMPHAGKNLPLVFDPVEQKGALASPAGYAIGLNFLGDGFGFPNYTFVNAPPDTNIAVGDTQVFEWVNSSFVIFNKNTGATLLGPLDGHMIFSGLGGECANGYESDPIAQWDNAAHRWLLVQNTFRGSPYLACVAVSTTPDALGSYYLYAFSLGDGFPDYPKWGRWTNSWTQTINNFGPGGQWWTGAEVCVYDRAKLLAGNPSVGQKCFQLGAGDNSLLPADIDSPYDPPPGEDVFLIGGLGMSDNLHLSLYSVHIDWANPDAATITGSDNTQLISVPEFNPACNGQYRAFCVPQNGVSDQLDSLGDRLMYRFAYWHDYPVLPHPVSTTADLPHQHFYVNHAVTASGGQMGTRWYEFRAPENAVPVTSLTVYQSGTFAPDSNYRWMGSVAQDKANDILLGYSVSNSSMYPSILIAGRQKSDPLGKLGPEVVMVNGLGSQLDTGGRWGDYSAMRIDQDGCTFWYTTQFYEVTQMFNWSSQIASIKFANCR